LRVGQSKPWVQLTGMFMAAVFLWMCTGVQLSHTDDFSSMMLFHRSSAHWAKVSVSNRPDDCLACLWSEYYRDTPSDPGITVIQSDLVPCPVRTLYLAPHVVAHSLSLLRGPPA